MIAPHVGSEECLDDHPVDAQRGPGLIPSEGLPPAGREDERCKGLFLEHEFPEEEIGQVQGNGLL